MTDYVSYNSETSLASSNHMNQPGFKITPNFFVWFIFLKQWVSQNRDDVNLAFLGAMNGIA